MVAVYTGNGLGLFHSSLSQTGLGAAGTAIGQGSTRQYVNAATGNLVLQSLDEALLVRGFTTGVLRTYNSRGTVAGQGQDGWQTGYERRVSLNGTLNAAGSNIVLEVGDGQTLTFAYTGQTNTYRTTDGEGAHDVLVWDSKTSTWTLTEGSSRREEVYASHADATQLGRLLLIRDGRSDAIEPAYYEVAYDGAGRVWKIQAFDGATDAQREALIFGYNAAGQLETLSTRENGVTRSQVSYGYQPDGRLSWIQTDLTPTDATDNTWDSVNLSSNDGRRFRTSFTYVSTSPGDLRVATVDTSDGVRVSYGYQSDGVGGYRIWTITLGSSSGNANDAPGQTTIFNYRAGATDVIDADGRTWTYEYDAQKRLTAVLEPEVNGLRAKTGYEYDGDGNLWRVHQVSPATGLVILDTQYQYHADGSRKSQRDLSGSVTEWTYNGHGQVATETRYTATAALTKGGMSVDPSTALTTRFVYDSRDRLRFEIDATGAVREIVYHASGSGVGQIASERRYFGHVYPEGLPADYTESALMTWTGDVGAMRRAKSSLTTYEYDEKGRLKQRLDYAAVDQNSTGAGLYDSTTSQTRYIHDAQGLLRQQITVRGVSRTQAGATPAGSEVVDYVYDGMGRLLSVLKRDIATAAMPDPQSPQYTTWLAANDATTLLTTYAYADASRQRKMTDDAGLLRVDLYASTGRLIRTTESGAGVSTRETNHYYDAGGLLRASRNAAGGMTYFFYDNAARLVGTVDETGAVQRLVLDPNGRVVGRIAYQTMVDTSGWLTVASGQPTVVNKTRLVFSPASPGLQPGDVWVKVVADSDRSTSYTYDGSGRLWKEVAGKLTTTYTYDAASRLLSVQLENVDDASIPKRVTRMFHDKAGRLLGTLDGDGYLSENKYDAGGRLVATVRYATLTNSLHWASGTLDQLRPVSSSLDRTTRFFHDAQGRQVAVLDAEGYLTVDTVDRSGNSYETRTYAKQLTGLSGNETLATLSVMAMSNAPVEPYRRTQRQFNALGQVAAEANHEGTVTTYQYDDAGRLVKTTTKERDIDSVGAERVANRRYDVFGNVIGELDGTAAHHLTSGMTQAQIEAVYSQYGTRHAYDSLGRRIETIDPDDNKTWYFYDNAGRQRYVVRAVADDIGVRNARGEVIETRYTTFGEVGESIAYTGRITIPVPGSRDSVLSVLNALVLNASSDSRVVQTYDQRGLLLSRTDAGGYRSGYSWNVFGELDEQTDMELDGSVRLKRKHQYNARGLLKNVTESDNLPVSLMSRTQRSEYNAFGEVSASIDALGNIVGFEYDRVGRMVKRTAYNVSGRNEVRITGYDAYSRTVTLTDEHQRVTSFVHSDNGRKVTTTTPDGVIVVTTHNGFGQTTTISRKTEGNTYITSSTTYDADGQVLTTKASEQLQETQNAYDDRGLLEYSIDASGRKIRYSYDAAGRVLTRREDPDGLNLTTTYVYDGQGRQIRVTDPTGRATRMQYDQRGQLTDVIQDPDGLVLTTHYTWDRDGRQLTVTEGFGTTSASTTRYEYDIFGRRTAEITGAGDLDNRIEYAYDANDNLIRKREAFIGRQTWYAYDAANRQTFTVDMAGGVTEVAYDMAGRQTMSRRYARALNIFGLTGTAQFTDSQIRQMIASQSISDDAKDETSYIVYSRDGLVAASIDGMGGVVRVVHDAAGRVSEERRHVVRLTMTATLRERLRTGAATPQEVVPASSSLDQLERRVYDVSRGFNRSMQRFVDIALPVFHSLASCVAVRSTGVRRHPAWPARQRIG